jgi:uncharacterized protein
MANEAASRFVIDTNTLVSGYLFPQSLPGLAFDRVLTSHQLLMSMEVAEELVEVMRREKFDRFLSPQRREDLVAGTIRSSAFVQTTTVVTDCRDIKDNKFLELAIDGQATAIITGDADLLILNPYCGIPILTPREYLTRG